MSRKLSLTPFDAKYVAQNANSIALVRSVSGKAAGPITETHPHFNGRKQSLINFSTKAPIKRCSKKTRMFEVRTPIGRFIFTVPKSVIENTEDDITVGMLEYE